MWMERSHQSSPQGERMKLQGPCWPNLDHNGIKRPLNHNEPTEFSIENRSNNTTTKDMTRIHYAFKLLLLIAPIAVPSLLWAQPNVKVGLQSNAPNQLQISLLPDAD